MVATTSTVVKPSATGMAIVERRSGEKVHSCYQCGNCSSTCPVAGVTGIDYTPRKVMRALQLGQIEEVLNSSFIWACVSCDTCVVRCPKQIDIPTVMDTLRHIARERGIKPRESEIVTFHESFMDLIKRGGRLYEVGLIGMMNLRTRRLFANVGVGIPMMTKGKVSLFPHGTSKGAAAATRIFKKVKKLERY